MEPAKHAPGAGPGKCVTGAGAHTASRKATEGGVRCVLLADFVGRQVSRPYDFGKLIADETEKWAKVIRAANIKAEWGRRDIP
jgi:hypothetical protein